MGRNRSKGFSDEESSFIKVLNFKHQIPIFYLNFNTNLDCDCQLIFVFLQDILTINELPKNPTCPNGYTAL